MFEASKEANTTLLGSIISMLTPHRFSIRTSLLLHVPIVGCRHSCFRSTVTKLHTCTHYLSPVFQVQVHRMNLKLQMFRLLEFCQYANDPVTHQCQSGQSCGFFTSPATPGRPAHCIHCLIPSSHCQCHGSILLTTSYK